jgi:hypothetical protein
LRTRFPAVIGLCILSLLGTARAQEFELLKTEGTFLFKGNTHTHTTMSDGDSPPEEVARWYKGHGFRFLVLSDHNTLTNPANLAGLVDSTFLLIPGEELTSDFRKKPIHVNGLNIQIVLKAQKDSTLLETIQKNVDAVRSAGGAPHINHPNFGWALDKETLLQVKNNSLLEIYNGHPQVHNQGGSGHASVEEVWDYLLTAGMRFYGIAVDDAHHFRGEFGPTRANPGRGWIVVGAAGLDAGEIMRNIEAGSFYSSTGVELDRVQVTPRRLTITIKQKSNFGYRTEFIGANGKTLLRSEENPAVYDLVGGEKYVRAKVTDSGGAIAWVQPVFVEEKVKD